jgi:hypothetical protein
MHHRFARRSIRIGTRGRIAALTLASLVASGIVLAGCGEGNVAFPTPPVATTTFEIPDPFDKLADPADKRRDGVFPVKLELPRTDVAVWTSVRREGDPDVDEELTFVVEGFVHAGEGFFLDYDVILGDDQGNMYQTQPEFKLGLLAPDEKRKFAVAANLPRDARVTSIEFRSPDGDVSRRLIYHIDLALARVPSMPLLPPGWEEAR